MTIILQLHIFSSNNRNILMLETLNWAITESKNFIKTNSLTILTANLVYDSLLTLTLDVLDKF